MESVDKICEQIRGDGTKEVESILEKARRTADAIIEKAESEAEKIGERILKEATEKGTVAKRRVLSSVNLEVRRIRLKVREEVVNAVMDAVHGHIEKGRSRSDYPGILAGLVAEAFRALDGEEFVVYADRRDIALLEPTVFPLVRELMKRDGRTVKRIETRALPEGTAGGVRVSVPGGKVIFDNTFEARMYRYREEMRVIVFDGVFTSGDKIE